MWCDTFDADLLKVVPGAAEALGDMAGLKLWTRSHTTDGKINLPDLWNDYAGMSAFFWLQPGDGPPAGYVTSHPEVGCTLLEAVRDLWVHTASLVIADMLVWTQPDGVFDALMYDLRGWARLSDEERADAQGAVRFSLRAAARRARQASAQDGDSDEQ